MNLVGKKERRITKGISLKHLIYGGISARFSLLLCLSIIFVAASSAQTNSDTAQQKVLLVKPSEMDPFLAGAMGIIPIASGFYVTDKPTSGLIFTLVDALLAMGVYTSRYTERGDPSDVKYYFVLMGVNNILDAWMSASHVARKRALQSRIGLLPEGGLLYAFQWKF